MKKGTGIYERQRRYRRVEGICRRYGDVWEYKDDSRE